MANHLSLRSEHESLIGVSVIASTHRPDYINHLLDNFAHQEYPCKELILILNSNQLKLKKWQDKLNNTEDVSVLQLDESVSLGECYNYAIEQARFPLISKFDDDDYYAPLYLHEAVDTYIISTADIVGKACRYVYFAGPSMLGICQPQEEYRFTSLVIGATMLFSKELWEQIKFRDLALGEDTQFQLECLQAGCQIYSGSRFNYVTIRRSNQESHTFKVEEQVYMATCQDFIKTSDYAAICSKNTH